MKKIMITLSCALLTSTTCFANPFFKAKNPSTMQAPQPTQHSFIDEDFSGRWKGHCDGEDIGIKLNQTKNYIELVDLQDEDDDEPRTERFYFNKMISQADSGNGFFAEHQLATWDKNERRLILTHLNFRSSLINSIFHDETMIMVKKGNQITVYSLYLSANTYTESADADKAFCVIHKS